MHNEDPLSEDELRLALRRVDPPAGFADAVLGRLGRSLAPMPDEAWGERQTLQAGTAGPVSREPRLVRFEVFRSGRAAAIAAALLFALILPLVGFLHQRHQQEQAEAAALQFSLAMRLTHEALEDAGAQIATHRHGHTGE